MFSIFRTFFTLLFSLSLAANVFAQTRRANGQASNPIVTATTSNGRVRYASLGEVNQSRLQIFSADGRQVYDSDLRLGNLIDWSLLDQQGQRLPDGAYAFLITVREFSGTLTQKYGTALLESDHVTLQQTAKEEMPQQQALALQANKVSEVLASVDRIGAAALSVAPSVTSQVVPVTEVVRASTQKTGTTTTTAAFAPAGDSLTGTGTQGRLAKWTDNTGTIGDSTIVETGGFVGIGTTAPGSRLVVSSNAASLPAANGIARFADADGVQTAIFADAFATNPILNVRRANGTAASPSGVLANQLLGVIGASGYGASTYVGTRGRVAFWAAENWTDSANGTYLTFNTTANGAATPGGAERVRIDPTGNVGIGTNNPQFKLDVNGDLNVVGNANISGNIAAKYQDVAEWVPARKPIGPGTLVILDSELTNSVEASRGAYDTRVAGVISPQPGLILGEAGEGKVLVATTGRVKIKVDATRHPIKIGDLLVTSNIPGVAMKSMPIKIAGRRIHRPGTIVGKALEPLVKGRGEILVLLSLQ